MGQRASVGTIIEGKYRLEEELGAGGMGSVWLATQLMVDRPVAVKLLHPAFIDQDDLQARFEVEAKAIGRLNHPNVITLYDFGFSEGLQAFYTVIEYIDGVSLDKRLSERLPLREVADIIRQIALALDHAHHFNILHRDLKPENVMLARMTDGSEMVKVLDFGIARIVKGSNQPETQESQRITKAGEVFGTPAYMSPEQARSIRQLQPSADLYSLGVMFYELVAGGLPFFAHSAFDLLMLHVTKPVPPIRRPGVPEDLQEIIQRLLEKDPEKRFQSGKELVEALDALDLPEEDVSVDDLDSGPTLIQKTPTPTIGAPPPTTLGDEQTNPETPPDFSVTPPEHLPKNEARQPTMMLDGSEEIIVETGNFATGSKRTRLIAIAAVLIGIVVVAGLASWAALQEKTAGAETGDTSAPVATQPEQSDPETTDEADPVERELAEAAAGTPVPDVVEVDKTTEEPATDKPAAAKLPAPEEKPADVKPEKPPKTKPARKKRRRKKPTRRRQPEREKKEETTFQRFGIDDGEESSDSAIPRMTLDE